jgi:hypothetical protein
MTRYRPTCENHKRLRGEALVRFAELIGLASTSRLASTMSAGSVVNIRVPMKTTLRFASERQPSKCRV